MLYLDTSALVSLFVSDAHSMAVHARLSGYSGDLAVSPLGIAEFGVALGNRVRSGALGADAAEASFVLLDRWLDRRADLRDPLPDDHWDAVHLVRHLALGLRAPDALHIAIARRLGATLLTFDTRQAEAARRIGVACDQVGA